MPLRVTFDDITHLTTIRLVDPAYLSACFGPGGPSGRDDAGDHRAGRDEGRVEAVLRWWMQMRSGPYNEMTSLRLPNTSPRGWKNLNALSFWSFDRVLKFNGSPN